MDYIKVGMKFKCTEQCLETLLFYYYFLIIFLIIEKMVVEMCNVNVLTYNVDKILNHPHCPDHSNFGILFFLPFALFS